MCLFCLSDSIAFFCAILFVQASTVLAAGLLSRQQTVHSKSRSPHARASTAPAAAAWACAARLHSTTTRTNHTAAALYRYEANTYWLMIGGLVQVGQYQFIFQNNYTQTPVLVGQDTGSSSGVVTGNLTHADTNTHRKHPPSNNTRALPHIHTQTRARF